MKKSVWEKAKENYKSRPGGSPKETEKAGNLSDRLTFQNSPLANLKENRDNPFEKLTDSDFENLKNDIQKNGVLVPLIVKKTGVKNFVNTGLIIDGHNRFRAAKALKLETVPVHFVEGDLSEKEVKDIATRLQILRRNLSPDDLALKLAELYPEYMENEKSVNRFSSGDTVSPLQIEKETGIHERTIKRAKELYQKAKKETGKKTLSPADLKATRDKLNENRKVSEQAKNDVSGTTESHETSPKETGQRKEHGENLSDFRRAGLAIADVRRAYGSLKPNERKVILKELEKVLEIYRM